MDRRTFAAALCGLGVAGRVARPDPARAIVGLSPQCPACFSMLPPPYGKTRPETRALLLTPQDIACYRCGLELSQVRFAELA